MCLLSFTDSKDVERVKAGNISHGDIQERDRRNLHSPFCTSEHCMTWITPVPNMGAALVGYNPFIGNRLLPDQSDPGMRNYIFSPMYEREDGRFDVNNFLHWGDATFCKSGSESRVVTNYEQYRKQKIGSSLFDEYSEQTSSLNIPFFSWLINYKKAESERRSSSWGSSFEREQRFFGESQGEIHMNEVKCEAYRIAVDDFLPPVFTPAFIYAMRSLQRAAKNPASRRSKRTLRKFFGAYGTHYMKETFLGASMITETKFSSASSSLADRRKRQQCVNEAFNKGLSKGVDVNEIETNLDVPAGPANVGAKTTTGGWNHNSESTFRNASQKCVGSQQDLSFFNSNQFKQTVITSVGSPPFSNRDKWLEKVKEAPAAVRFKLKNIKDIFRPDWINMIPLDESNPAAGNLDADLLFDYFEENFLNYCEIMLGRPCPNEKATVVLSSTAGAAEYQGARLGEFVEAGEHGGRPFFTQRDTEGVSDKFLYSEGGKWWVSDILGESSGWLRNKQDSPFPPSGTWEFWSSSRIPKGWQDDDTSLTLTFFTLSPCKMVRVTGRGDVVEKQRSKLGDYRLEVGRWSQGRPVYKKVDGQTLYLLVKESFPSWYISSSTTGTTGFIHSGRGTNYPSSPEAGPSVRSGYTGWRYWDGGWQDGDISVTCV